MMNVTNSEEALKSYCKSKGYEKPIYEIISRASTRLDDNTYRHKHYICSVTVNGKHLANGDGFSKRIARKKAAMYGLQNLRILEMSNFFNVFRDILPQRAIGYGQRESTNVQFSPSVEIEEMLSIENVYNEILSPAVQNNCPKSPDKQLSNIEETTKKSTTDGNDVDNVVVVGENQHPPTKINETNSNSRRDSDPSQDLILAAIAKLRSYDEVVDEIKTHHNGNNNNDKDKQESKVIKFIVKENVEQMQQVTKEILNLNLDGNNNNNNNSDDDNGKSIEYIDDVRCSPLDMKTVLMEKIKSSSSGKTDEKIYKI